MLFPRTSVFQKLSITLVCPRGHISAKIQPKNLKLVHY